MNALSQNVKKNSAKIFLLFSLMLAFFLLPKNCVKANTLNEFVLQPIVEYPKNMSESVNTITVKGMTISPTKTRVYLDNKNLGYAQNEIGQNGWLNFSLTLSQNLEIGPHKIEFVADYYDKFSSPTTTVNITVTEKLRGPTLFEPVVNSETNRERPWVVGVTPNDSQVEIYLDDKFDGWAEVKNDPNGTASFKYRPKQKLTVGTHIAKARVSDQNKNVSSFSKETVLNIKKMSAVVAPAIKGEVSNGIAAENELENKIINEENNNDQSAWQKNWWQYLVGLIVVIFAAILIYWQSTKNKNKQRTLFETKTETKTDSQLEQPMEANKNQENN